MVLEADIISISMMILFQFRRHHDGGRINRGQQVITLLIAYSVKKVNLS